ncbi:MAG: hypothetical protein J0I07_21630 [Myxococcales bacterium]|nr:hypothetical protein [Myxococcales bacterium]
MAAAGASCSSGEEEAALPPPDSPDAAASPETSQVAADAGGEAPPLRDAAPFDGGPLPVVCTSPPCAHSLVTTLPTQFGANPTEGFCALLDDGTVACWGANVDGQLGRGEQAGTADSPHPARVVGLSNVVELDHSCARTANGDVLCWGRGSYVRNDTSVPASELAPVKVPIPPAKKIGWGAGVGCAATDDELLCWGSNEARQIDRTGSFGMRPPMPIGLPPGAPIRDILIGLATFVLREDGSTLSWGRNPPLARASSLSPGDPNGSQQPDGDPYPAPAALGAVSSIDLTGTSGCATVGGTGYCWGAIDIVGLPPADAPSPLVNALPKPVVAPEPLVGIATTSTAAVTDFADDRIVWPQRWCAVGASGAVYCWGLNSQGQAGDGTKDHAYHAVKVKGLPAPAAEVKAMPLSTCALLTTGKVYCWGNNAYGQLGRGMFGMAEGGSLAPQEVVLP